jgi:hypothetical protein
LAAIVCVRAAGEIGPAPSARLPGSALIRIPHRRLAIYFDEQAIPGGLDDDSFHDRRSHSLCCALWFNNSYFGSIVITRGDPTSASSVSARPRGTNRVAGETSWFCSP